MRAGVGKGGGGGSGGGGGGESAVSFEEARELLVWQCELLLLLSALFGLYDFCYYYFSFVIDPADYMPVVLARYVLLVPALGLLRVSIRRLVQSFDHVDRTGALLVALPALAAILMVATAPRYALPCAVVSANPSCATTGTPPSLPPLAPFAPYAPPPPLALAPPAACFSYVQASSHPQYCYAGEPPYSYVKTLGMLSAFFAYTHVHAHVQYLATTQVVGSLLLVGVALLVEWGRIEPADTGASAAQQSEQQAAMRLELAFGLTLCAVYIASSHAVGFVYNVTHSQLVWQHAVLAQLQRELLTVIKQVRQIRGVKG
eukprot:123780-Prymnesium_polylepis.1